MIPFLNLLAELWSVSRKSSDAGRRGKSYNCSTWWLFRTDSIEYAFTALYLDMVFYYLQPIFPCTRWEPTPPSSFQFFLDSYITSILHSTIFANLRLSNTTVIWPETQVNISWVCSTFHFNVARLRCNKHSLSWRALRNFTSARRLPSAHRVLTLSLSLPILALPFPTLLNPFN